MARKSKFNPKYHIPWIAGLAARGYTIEDMAEDIGVAQSTVRDELTPFTAKWLQDNIDRNSILYRTDVQIMISDVISDERGDAGCIDIIYNGMFWCISKGLASKEWLCTCSNEFRNDCWIPNVRSIADFKRLWRVATGFVLPLKDEK